MPLATPTRKFRDIEPVKISMFLAMSTADITALKAALELDYAVSFTVTGIEFQYTAVLEGPKREVSRAMPKVKPISEPFLRQPSQIG